MGFLDYILHRPYSVQSKEELIKQLCELGKENEELREELKILKNVFFSLFKRDYRDFV